MSKFDLCEGLMLYLLSSSWECLFFLYLPIITQSEFCNSMDLLYVKEYTCKVMFILLVAVTFLSLERTVQFKEPL